MSIRVNIVRIGDRPAPTGRMEQVSGVLLAVDYVISVANYLNLFGVFALSLTPVAGPVAARSVTTAAYLLIVILGWTRGFDALERLEYPTVRRKLAVIAALLAALAAQFSAASADTGGAGGLLVELTGRRHTAWQGYLALVAIGLVLTWAADVFQIIAYASRAFAAYSGVQSLIAARHAQGAARPLHGALVLLAVTIVLFGVPIEG